ncbi:MAG: sarcosine oxidase subunit gamma [Pseudomonadota bacterium]
MANPTPRPPTQFDPISIGQVTLSAMPQAPIWAIAPYRGQTDALSDALQDAHGLRFPAPGTSVSVRDIRLAWSGLGQAFLFGAQPDDQLATYAALTDQSDAWTHVILDGTGAEDVLARLTPLDLSIKASPVGSVRRSQLGHMAALILRASVTGFEILTFRSMADTTVHDLTRAMRAVSARAARAH